MFHRTTLKVVFALAISTVLASNAAHAQLPKSLTNGLGGSSSSSSGQGMLGQLGSQLPIPSIPSIGSSNSGSAAGILQYCIQNNYLSASSASSVKDQLLQKSGISSNDSQFQKGSQGTLTGTDGTTFSLSNIKGQVAKAVCNRVLGSAQSLL